MLGQQAPCGTGDSEILFDEEHMFELMKTNTNKIDHISDNIEHYYDEEDEDEDVEFTLGILIVIVIAF